tara:strand:+ start:2033 stop:3517 length:1485 start_codon:yes stop_codon:yes gene_type:complete
MHLFQIVSDRKKSFNKVSSHLFKLFKEYINKNFSFFFSYYKFFYGLNKETLRRKVTRRIAILYSNQKGSHDKSLFMSQLPKYLILYLGLLFYFLINSKILTKKKYDLIIYDIYYYDEITRIKRLIDYFDKNKVLIFVQDKDKRYANYNTIYFQNFKRYSFFLTLKILFIEIFFGIPFYLFLSTIYKVNLFPLAMRIINNYNKYSTHFYFNSSKYLYMERCIKIDPLMKDMFHKNHGKCLFTSQKSNLAGDQTSLCYDFDVFFTLGTKSHLRSNQYSSRIKKTVPIGSLFHHQRLINHKTKEIIKDPNYDKYHYDLLFVGGNMMNCYDLYDDYDDFLKDYYDTIRWLVRIKEKKPYMRIGIKHHPTAKEDKFENEIIKNSDVESVDNSLESYQLVLNSEICATHASILGYESFLLGKHCLFLDPQNNSKFISYKNENALVDKYRASNFEEFNEKIELLLNKDKNFIYYDKKSLDELVVHVNDPYKIIYETLLIYN